MGVAHDGRPAIVTGAAGTIGRVTAQRPRDRGAVVALVDRNRSVVDVASDIGDRCLARVVDSRPTGRDPLRRVRGRGGLVDSNRGHGTGASPHHRQLHLWRPRAHGVGADRRDPDQIAEWAAESPLGRLATPAHVAAAAARLTPDDAFYITSEALNVSGGMCPW